MKAAWSRREFLAASGASALVLSLSQLLPRTAAAAAPSGPRKSGGSAPGVRYRAWEDLYRERWRWDRIVAGTHLRTDCISACAWDLYVRDGLVWREEQAGRYLPTNDHLPDFGPRGCQKGACYSDLMYSPARVKYPLKRVGPRGSGRWQRVSWEEALGDIADRLLDIAASDGPESIWYDHGTTNVDFGAGTAGEQRLFHLLGATVLDSWGGVGDLPMGAIQTWGMFNVDGTADDWFESDYLVVWLANPVYTRIPEMHFMLEARYRGARVVVIAPDYSASAVHADLWVNPRLGTDAALALAMAQVIVAERLYRAEYLREQTDLPLLVRDDTRRFLREADTIRGGREDVFYWWDTAAGRPVQAPGSHGLGGGPGSLALGGRLPALEGRFRVRLESGKEVGVRPVFACLEERLAALTPERAAAITGVAPAVIRRVARELAAAGAALIFASWGSCKHYHSDLMQRAMILLAALTGNQGRRGGGVRIGAWWGLEGFERFSNAFEPTFWQWLYSHLGRPDVRTLEALFTRLVHERISYAPLLVSLYEHGGLAAAVDPAARHDPTQRPMAEAMAEARRRRWMPAYPRGGKRPRAYIFSGCNPLRRWPAPQLARRHLWPHLDLVVSINFRLSTSGAFADYVLPAAGYYEKRGIKFTQSYLPYVVVGEQAVPPLHESLGEWDMCARLARAIEERARARSITPFADAFAKPRDPASIYEEWSMGGRFNEGEDVKVLDYILSSSPVTAGTTWAEAAAVGAVPIRATGRYSPLDAVCSDLEPGKTVYPSRWFVEGKEPWPTLTGRQQFYIDHPWYLDAGEELPVHKDPPPTGGRYPLRLSGGHTRWSIHAIWRDERHLLRLQRGEPVLYIPPAEARPRGIADNARVRVRNDIGSFVARAKLARSLPPGQVLIYHAWEPYQFPGWRGSQEVVGSPWKPLHLVGDYGQLHYRVFLAQPGHTPRATTVEVELVADGEAGGAGAPVAAGAESEERGWS